MLNYHKYYRIIVIIVNEDQYYCISVLLDAELHRSEN